MTTVNGAPDRPHGRGAAVSHWRPALALVSVALALVFAAYWPTVVSLGDLWWNNSDYGHGLLVAPLSLYLAWGCRAELARLEPRHLWPAAFAVLALALAWLVASLAEIRVGEQLSLVLLVGAALLALLGPRVARVLAFPLGYLLLVIPVWSVLTPILQARTAAASTSIVQMLGVPVLLEGYYMTIPEGQFVVAEVCAGMRFLLATMAIAALYGYLNFTSFLRAAVFFVFAVAVAIVNNWLRVVVIVMTGHLTDMQGYIVHSHIGFGWFMFALGLVPIFYVGWLMREPEPPAGEGAPADRAASAGAAGARPYRVRAAVACAVLTVALASSGPLAKVWYDHGATRLETAALRPVPPPPGWQAAGTFDWGIRFHGNAGERLDSFTAPDGASAAAYVAFYPRQREGAEVINDRNRIFDPGRWTSVSEHRRRLSLPSGERIPIREAIVLARHRGAKRIVWYWYLVAGEPTAGSYRAKWRQLQGLVRGRADAAAVALALEYRGDDEAARARLDRIAQALAPVLHARLESLAAGP